MNTLLARQFAGLRLLTNSKPVSKIAARAIRVLKIQKCEMKTCE